MIPTITVREGIPHIEYCPNTPETCQFHEGGAHHIIYCQYASKNEAIRCPNTKDL